ncbi:MAG: PilZ domain-containing protein [Desulfofustis sp.]|jgi:hypothetical protein
MSSEERRESYRMTDVSKANAILFDGKNRFEGTLKNLSRTGFLLDTDTQPELSKIYQIEITLSGAHSRLIVDTLSGLVTRSDGEGVAVEFTEEFEWLVLAPIFF